MTDANAGAHDAVTRATDPMTTSTSPIASPIAGPRR